MTKYKYLVKVEEDTLDGERGFCGVVIDVIGVFDFGCTKEELLANLREGLVFMAQSLKKRGKKIEKPLAAWSDFPKDLHKNILELEVELED